LRQLAEQRRATGSRFGFASQAQLLVGEHSSQAGWTVRSIWFDLHQAPD
jgi:hypothetical protein